MKKDLLFIWIAVVICVSLVFGINITTVDEYYTLHNEVSESGNLVTVSVDCSNVYENYAQLKDSLKIPGILPSDGKIIPLQNIGVSNGDTVYDVTSRACNRLRVAFDVTGGDYSKYVRGIGALCEFDCGATSGWIYKVNGTVGEVGCSRYKVKVGDRIEWIYSCNLESNNMGGNFEQSEK